MSLVPESVEASAAPIDRAEEIITDAIRFYFGHGPTSVYSNLHAVNILDVTSYRVEAAGGAKDLVNALEEAMGSFDFRHGPAVIHSGRDIARILKAAKEKADNAKNVANLVAALKSSMTALDDWLHTYAPEFCDPGHVADAQRRIGERGTLSYITEVQQRNRNALRPFEDSTCSSTSRDNQA